MRLSHFYLYARHVVHFQGFQGDTIGKILEVADVTVCHDRRDEIVELTVVDDTFRAMCDVRARSPDGHVHFYRLRYLSLVRKHTDARVEAHRPQGDDVAVSCHFSRPVQIEAIV